MSTNKSKDTSVAKLNELAQLDRALLAAVVAAKKCNHSFTHELAVMKACVDRNIREELGINAV